jgi:dUTP pyrophosphatase
MDLFSCENVSVPPKGKALIDIGLKMAIPAGYYGRVAPRSGLAVKNFIDVGAGNTVC